MNASDYALIKQSGLPGGYWVVFKEVRSYTLFEDNDDSIREIENLLANNVEVFENENEFHKIYPPLTDEERLKILKEFPANRHSKSQ